MKKIKYENFDIRWTSYDFRNDLLADVLEKVKLLIELYGDDAKLELEVIEDYGSPYVGMDVIVPREETDEEYEKRIGAESYSETIARANRFAQYKALQKEFG